MCKDMSIVCAHMLQLTQCPVVAATCPERKKPLTHTHTHHIGPTVWSRQKKEYLNYRTIQICGLELISILFTKLCCGFYYFQHMAIMFRYIK